MKPYVIKKGIVAFGRAAWAHLDHPKLGKIGVVVVYAPNEPLNRASLWSELVDSLDMRRRWIMAGDLNMVEDILDRKGGSGKVVCGREKGAWKRLIRKFCLEDSNVYKVGHLKYSWDSKKIHQHNPIIQNKKNIGDRVLKRIERIHCTVTQSRNTFQVTSSILPGFAFFDHAPVIGVIKVGGKIEGPSIYHMNVKDLQDEKLVGKLEEMWEELRYEVLMDNTLAEHIFFKGLYKSKRITRTHGKLKATLKKKKETELQATLAIAQLRLEEDIQSTSA